MSMIERALRSATPPADDLGAVVLARTARLIAIGEAVEQCKVSTHVGDVRLGDGKHVWSAASLLAWLTVVADEPDHAANTTGNEATS